jgi:hypothetical protein
MVVKLLALHQSTQVVTLHSELVGAEISLALVSQTLEVIQQFDLIFEFVFFEIVILVREVARVL